MTTPVARPPAEVVGFYSRVGRLFELWGRVTDSRARARVLELCDLRDGEAVLEVGVGAGTQLLQLASANPAGRTVGIDLAEGMLAEARRRTGAAGVAGVQLLAADARALAFEDDSFDLVTSAYVLDILPEPEIRQALAELARVLRPGGRMVLCHVTLAERRAHRLPELLYGSGLPLTGNCRGILLAPALRDFGFAEIHREYGAQMLLPSEILFARLPGSRRSMTATFRCG